MRRWLYDLTSFFFPEYCPVCGEVLFIPDQVICLLCENRLPATGYINDPENPVAQLFWGRVELEGATSLFRFEKGSKYQTLLHRLKYKGEKNIGVYLGQMLGAEIPGTDFGAVDFIVPVPLHRKKEKSRGYNQSEVIAQGISIVTGISILNTLIFRQVNTSSQTRKGRFERWQNMENVFTLAESSTLFEGCNFLLVDDVVTTGSTLEACATTLKKISGAKVYIATIACA